MMDGVVDKKIHVNNLFFCGILQCFCMFYIPVSAYNLKFNFTFSASRKSKENE